jgi:tartrate dehydratase beta subunit/fumarate hydratase class I family protein
MVVPLSAPLSRQLVSGLCAGDEVVLSGPVLLVRCDHDADDEPAGGWPAETVDGGICCLLMLPAAAGSGGWQVARIDDASVDRAVRALLATGARGVIAAGRCLATTSYAFRKYGGVFFAVGPDWLAETKWSPLPLGSQVGQTRHVIAVVEVDRAPLTVAHDARGRSVWERGPRRGGLG